MSGTYRGCAESLDRIMAELAAIADDIDELRDGRDLDTAVRVAIIELARTADELHRKASRKPRP